MIKRFIKWIKFNPPYAANADGWVEFDEKFKKEAPIRYAITRGPIKKSIWRIKFFFSRRFYKLIDITLDRKHLVDTGLKPGYYSTHERMLHANFSLLVYFVENECSRIYASVSSEKMINLFGWKAFLPWRIRMALKRNREYAKEYGLKYLNWCIEKESEDHQRDVSHLKMIVSLYVWWTEIRPNRKELKSPLHELRSDPNTHIMLTSTTKWQKENPELLKAHEDYMNQREKQEKDWDAEDEHMLIELMKIRKKLFF